MSKVIKKVAVLGAGVMGSGIAAHVANAGVPCVLLDIVPPNLSDAEKENPAARSSFASGAIKKALKAKPAAFTANRFADLVTTGNFDDHMNLLEDCDWIIEVVVENLAIKKKLFDKVEEFRSQGSIVSSNTSGISMASMLEGRSDDFRKNFLVTHFFNPPRYMKLLELVVGDETAEDVVEAIVDFGERKLGKGIVYAKDTPNFIANRIGVFSMFQTMKAMVDMGYTVEEIDAIAGAPMARPKSAAFRTADLVGLDTLVHVANNVYDNLPDDERREIFQIPEFLKGMLDKGWLGNKTRGGFYKKEKTPEGKKNIFYLDYASMEYKPIEKPRFDSCKVAKNTEDPAKRIKKLVYYDDKGGKLAWNNLAETLIYTANRLGEIADDVVNIDNAMKWGFNWSLGPFEYWDAIGLEESIKKMEEDGLQVPQVAKDVLEKGKGTFYVYENGKRTYYDVKTGEYLPVPAPKGAMTLQYVKDMAKTNIVKQNGSATLIDIGDDVLCLEFQSKMNAIDNDITDMMHEARELLDKDDKWAGMIITNQSDNFSVGANLMLIWMMAAQKNFGPIEEVVDRFQYANHDLKYCSKPVVAAPFGMALGGGCEVLLGADKVVAHSELYAGLVEVGVGLIPGGGGTVEVLTRFLENIPADLPADRFPYIQRVFETIGMAKVSFSAQMAQDMKLLRLTDRIVMSKDHLIQAAKGEVLGMYQAGYEPPRHPHNLILPGEAGMGAFHVGLFSMELSGWISEHDKKIALKLGRVLTGGDCQPNTAVSVHKIYELEKEAFMSLVGEQKSLDRMQHMLQRGKPLRN